MNDKVKKTTVITPPAIGCYVFLTRAQPSMNPGGDPQFAITLVFPKTADLSEMKAAAKAAAEKKWGNKIPSNLRNPFRDGNSDKPDDPTFADSIFVSARTKQKPGAVGPDRQPLNEPDFDLYSGMRCRASVTAFAYDTAGNKGVSFALNNVQKLADGERLSGRREASDEFASAPPLPEEAAAPPQGDTSMFD
jgi:hypothetical protein